MKKYSNTNRKTIITLATIAFILAIIVIITSQRPSIPSQSPIGGGWTDDGIIIRLTEGTDNVGIGTDSPLTKLDIIGNIKISDGTEGEGKVLTSDINGLASWQTPQFGESGGVIGNGTPNFVPLWVTNSSLSDSNMKIDDNGNIILKPGSSIFILSMDGSKCIQLSGQSLTIYKEPPLPPPCLSF